MVTTFNKTDLKKFGQFIADHYCDEEIDVTNRDINNFLVEKQFEAFRDFQTWTPEDFPEDKRDAFRELQPYLNNLVMTDIFGSTEEREERRLSPDGTF